MVKRPRIKTTRNLPGSHLAKYRWVTSTTAWIIDAIKYGGITNWYRGFTPFNLTWKYFIKIPTYLKYFFEFRLHWNFEEINWNFQSFKIVVLNRFTRDSGIFSGITKKLNTIERIKAARKLWSWNEAVLGLNNIKCRKKILYSKIYSKYRIDISLGQ